MQIKEIRPIFTAHEVAARIQELGKEIDAMYGDEPLVIVGVLKGASIFFADLVRSVQNPEVELDFVRVSSYGLSDCSSHSVVMNKDVEIGIQGKHVLLVEDIVDTGHSLQYLYDVFSQRGARTLRTAVLLDKKERREVKVHFDFVAFTIDEGFVVGYGLDFAEKYRHLPEICILEFE